jgi:hypothetical protein
MSEKSYDTLLKEVIVEQRKVIDNYNKRNKLNGGRKNGKKWFFGLC